MHAGRPVRRAGISCHIGRVLKWCLKGSVTCKLFTGFFCCVQVSHNLDCLDVLYRASVLIATFNSTRIMFKAGVLDITAHTICSSSSSLVSLVL